MKERYGEGLEYFELPAPQTGQVPASKATSEVIPLALIRSLLGA